MPITVRERGKSRAGDGLSSEWLYQASGDGGRADVILALLATAPPLDGVLIRDDDRVRADVLGPGLWDCTVPYSLLLPGKPPATGESEFSFEIGGGQIHITQSLAVVQTYPSGAPDCGRVIGPHPDGEGADGADVYAPAYQFSETHYKPAAFVTNAYRGKLFVLAGTVNTAAFRDLQAGECLFLGASGSRRGNGDWAITYRFAGSPNVTNWPVGDFTVSKKGWEHAHVVYRPKVIGAGANKITIAWPKRVDIHKVYRDGNFAELGI